MISQTTLDTLYCSSYQIRLEFHPATSDRQGIHSHHRFLSPVQLLCETSPTRLLLISARNAFFNATSFHSFLSFRTSIQPFLLPVISISFTSLSKHFYHFMQRHIIIQYYYLSSLLWTGSQLLEDVAHDLFPAAVRTFSYNQHKEGQRQRNIAHIAATLFPVGF